jgi:hypothetical protein
MNLRAPLNPEVNLARFLRGALSELQEAERLLVSLETATPNADTASTLAIVRDVIMRLSKVPPRLLICLFCHKPLQSDELAVFRSGVRIAHLGCWRPGPTPTPSRAAVDTSELASTGQKRPATRP